MCDQRPTDRDEAREGLGAAPLLIGGVGIGFVCAVSAAFLGAGWILVLVTYWLAGTVGLLAVAAATSGALRLPRIALPRLRQPVTTGYVFATAARRVRR